MAYNLQQVRRSAFVSCSQWHDPEFHAQPENNRRLKTDTKAISGRILLSNSYIAIVIYFAKNQAKSKGNFSGFELKRGKKRKKRKKRGFWRFVYNLVYRMETEAELDSNERQ